MRYYIRAASYDTDLNPAPAGFVVGTAGTVHIYNQGQGVTIPSDCVVAGQIYPIAFTRMENSRTSAVNVMFLYESK